MLKQQPFKHLHYPDTKDELFSKLSYHLHRSIECFIKLERLIKEKDEKTPVSNTDNISLPHS